MVKKGIDPAIEEGRQRQAAIEAEKQRQTPTFKSAFEEYLRRKASKLKSGSGTKREMRRDFKDWMDRPLADIFTEMKGCFNSQGGCFINKNYRLFRVLAASGEPVITGASAAELMTRAAFGSAPRFTDLLGR